MKTIFFTEEFHATFFIFTAQSLDSYWRVFSRCIISAEAVGHTECRILFNEQVVPCFNKVNCFRKIILIAVNAPSFFSACKISSMKCASCSPDFNNRKFGEPSEQNGLHWMAISQQIFSLLCSLFLRINSKAHKIYARITVSS